MSLIFYSCGDQANKMNKSLTQLGSTSYFKPNYQNGTTQVSYLLDSGMPSGTNYIYDSDLGRYYFVVEVVHDTAKRIIVNCLLDALYTFRGKLGGTFYFVRGSEKVNEMEDTNYPLSDYIKTETFNIDGWDNTFFKNVDAGNHYYLKTAVGRAQTKTYISLSDGDTVHYSNIDFVIQVNESIGGWNLSAYPVGESVPPHGPSIKVGTLVRVTYGGETKDFICDSVSTASISFDEY